MIRKIQRPYVMGMDIGSSVTRFGVVDARGNIICSDSVNTQNYQVFADFVMTVTQRIGVLIEHCGGPDKIKAMGIDAPNANYFTRNIKHAMNLPWHEELPLAALLQDQLGITVGLNNDANATALGEMFYGGARGLNNFVEVTVGKGVGAGIVMDGKLLYGADGNAGEIGHVCVRPNGRPCKCGLAGCLEAYCASDGIVKTLGELLEESDKPCVFRELSLEGLTSYDIYKAAEEGDELSIETFRRTGEILGEGLASVVHNFAPESIILQGGVIKAGEMLLGPAQESMEAHLLPVFRDKVNLSVSELEGKDAALLGAAAFAWGLKEYRLFI